MSSDPISDMLTKIVNASRVRSERVDIPRSKIKEDIAKVLQNEGFIKSYKFIEDRKQGILRLYLKYGPNNETVINGVKRLSKPSLRSYAGNKNIPEIFGGLGVVILSTSKGILTDKEARNLRIGGEILCCVW